MLRETIEKSHFCRWLIRSAGDARSYQTHMSLARIVASGERWSDARNRDGAAPNADTHFSFTNALGIITVEQVRGIETAAAQFREPAGSSLPTIILSSTHGWRRRLLSASAHIGTFPQLEDQMTNFFKRDQLSPMIGLRKTPIPPSISTSTTSPGFIHSDGFRAKPTPSGVPVEITSPPTSGVQSEQ